MGLGAITIEIFLAGGFAVFAISTAVLVIRSGRTTKQLAEIASHQQRVQGILADSPDPWLILNDGKVTEHSSDLKSDLGLNMGLIRSLDDLGLVPADHPDSSLAEMLEDTANAGKPGVTAYSKTGDRVFEMLVPQPVGGGDAIVWLEEATEPTRLKRALAESQRLSSTLFDTLDKAPAPLWRRDNAQRLEWVNEAYAQAVDAASPSQVIDDQIELGVSSLARPLKEMAQEAVEANSELRERHFIVMDGQRRAVDIVQTALPGGGVVGTLSDVTEAEEMRAELSRHIESHTETLNRINTPVAVFGPDKALHLFNNAFAEMSQLPESWLSSRPQHDMVLESMREKNRLPEQPDFPKWKTGRMSLYTEHIDSHEDLWTLLDSSTWRVVTQPHAVGGLIEFYEDVTDRLALEQSYNTLSAVQKETLDHLHEAVVVFGSDGRLKIHNDPYAEMISAEPGSLGGEVHLTDIIERVRPLVPGNQGAHDSLAEATQAQFNSREASSGTIEFSNGRTYNYRWVPLPDGAMLCSFDDATDTNRAERALHQRNEALEITDRLKSEIIARVSHEVRGPLNTIMGFAEIMTSELISPLDPQQKPYLDGILQSTHQLKDLLNDMLEFVSLESEEIVLDQSNIEVPTMLDDVAQLFAEQATSRGLRLDVSCPEGIVRLNADERRIKQALFTLLSNAMNTPFDDERIKLSAENGVESLKLSVTSSGRLSTGNENGESEDVMLREDFSEEGARGLGLSIVHRIMDAHHGKLVLEETGDGRRRISCVLPL